MEASLDLILEIGPDVIERRVLDLAAKTRECYANWAPPSPIRFPHRRRAIRAARCFGFGALALKEQRVLVAARRGHLRVSPHLYNNEQDLDIFERALRALL